MISIRAGVCTGPAPRDTVQHVWVVRHGAQSRERDPHLTAGGRRDAEAVAARLVGEPIGRILISPMRRTRETADPLVSALPGVPASIDERLRERIEFDPDAPGASWRAFRTEWDRTEQDRDHVPPVGDSSHAAAARLRAAIMDALPQTGDLVVVTHGGITLDLVRDLLPDAAIVQARPDVGGGLHHASVTRLDVVDGRLRVGAVGDTQHLGR